MRHSLPFFLRPFQFLLDLITLSFSFEMGLILVNSSFSGHYQQHLFLFFLLSLSWGLVVGLLRPYQHTRLKFHVFTLIYRHLIAVLLFSAFGIFIWMLLQDFHLSRLQLFFTFLLFWFLGCVWRTAAVVLLKIYRANGNNTLNYVIVGYNETSQRIKRFYDQHPEFGYKFYGYYDELNTQNKPSIRGDYTVLNQILASNQIDTVYCCIPRVGHPLLKDIVEKSNTASYKVKLVVDFAFFFSQAPSLEFHGITPVISLSSEFLDHSREYISKRLFDVIFSSTILLLGSPIFILLGLITKITSRGPIIFSQVRLLDMPV